MLKICLASFFKHYFKVGNSFPSWLCCVVLHLTVCGVYKDSQSMFHLLYIYISLNNYNCIA